MVLFLLVMSGVFLCTVEMQALVLAVAVWILVMRTVISLLFPCEPLYLENVFQGPETMFAFGQCELIVCQRLVMPVSGVLSS